jgi:hypothetical protein
MQNKTLATVPEDQERAKTVQNKKKQVGYEVPSLEEILNDQIRDAKKRGVVFVDNDNDRKGRMDIWWGTVFIGYAVYNVVKNEYGVVWNKYNSRPLNQPHVKQLKDSMVGGMQYKTGDAIPMVVRSNWLTCRPTKNYVGTVASDWPELTLSAEAEKAGGRGEIMALNGQHRVAAATSLVKEAEAAYTKAFLSGGKAVASGSEGGGKAEKKLTTAKEARRETAVTNRAIAQDRSNFLVAVYDLGECPFLRLFIARRCVLTGTTYRRFGLR